MKLHRSHPYTPLKSILCVLIAAGLSPFTAWAGTTASQSDASAVAWATQAMVALTGSVQPNGVNLQGSVSRTVNGNPQSGSVTLQATGPSNSQVAVTFGSATVSEVRTFGANGPSGQWIDANGTAHKLAQHNLWTDAVWFFPALSTLASYADPNLIFSDLGQELHGGRTVEHLRVYRSLSTLPPAAARVLALMSVTDYYLDSQTALPVATLFFAHADDDAGVSIPVEITFSSYQRVNQALVPYQITKYYNGTQHFQILVTSAQVQ